MGFKYRPKASELFQKRGPFFGEKVSFEKAFPTIEDVLVEVKEQGQGAFGDKIRYKKSSIGEYIDCSNPLCYNGGFSIGRILRKMIENKQTELETSKFCKGYEGSPKGKRRYRNCINRFKIKVNIKYKKEEKEGD